MSPEHTDEPGATAESAVYRQVAIIVRAEVRFADATVEIERRLDPFPHRRLPPNPDLRLAAYEFGPDVDIAAVLDLLRAQASVESADQNRFLQASWVVNDPLYRHQWALSRIRAEPAWRHALSSLNPAAPPVVIGIVDSGIHVRHPDLVPHLWDDGAGNHGYNMLTGTTNVADTEGHGTLLAGVIGAVSNNAIGIAAAQWPVRLMAVKFFDAVTPPDALRASWAIWWAVVNGAHIIVASWGLGVRFGGLWSALDFARQQGRLVVAAAGNDGLDNDVLPSYPASYGVPPPPTMPLSNVIAVMAAERPDYVTVATGDRRDDKAWFSNYGARTVHIAAPGVGVLTTHSYFRRPQWRAFSGTSAACALVTYAAALLKTLNPAWAPSDIRDHLVASVDRSPWLQCIARGRLNLDRAVVGPFVITLPAFGDVWAAGAPAVMTWRRRYRTPVAMTVRILLSRDGAPFAPIAVGRPNTGTSIVMAGPPANRAIVRVQSEQGPGLYADSAAFTIV